MRKQAPSPPLSGRSRRCSGAPMTTTVQQYEAIFPNPKMSHLAWIVTHLQIVPLLLAYRFSRP